MAIILMAISLERIRTQPVTEDLDQLLKIGLFCNNAQFIKEENRWNIQGDPTEGALLTLAAKRWTFTNPL